MASVAEEESEEGVDETGIGEDIGPEDPSPEPPKKKRRKGKVSRDSDFWVCVEKWLVAQVGNCGGDRVSESWKRCDSADTRLP